MTLRVLYDHRTRLCVGGSRIPWTNIQYGLFIAPERDERKQRVIRIAYTEKARLLRVSLARSELLFGEAKLATANLYFAR